MLKRNIISNFIGNGYVVVLQFALVPILLRYLGTEAYGLIGIYATLLALINLLDFGLSPTLTRELARLSANPNSDQQIKNTLSTLETLCIGIALIMILFFVISAPLLSKHWLSNNSLPTETVVNCLRLMGAQAAFQLVTNFYTSGMQGLQRMFRANGILFANHTIRAVLALFVLIQLNQGTEVYFISQLVATVIGLFFTVYGLYSALPKLQKVNHSSSFFLKIICRFNLDSFNACKKYIGALAIISFCSFLITQTDKIILTKIVSLADFGLYSIAASIAITVAGGAGLISRAVLPRMTQLVVLNELETLKVLYFKTLSFVAWLILVVASVLILFHEQILTIYLGNNAQLPVISRVFMLLMFGYALHSLMYIPYTLTLAYDWVRFGITTSIVAFVIMVPLTTICTLKYGILGAATAWVVITVIYLGFCLIFLHRRIFKGCLLKSYQAFAMPLLILITTFIYSFFY